MSVRSPVSSRHAASSPQRLSVADMWAYAHAGVFGVASSWASPASAAGLPQTDAFSRPQGGIIVSAPGLPLSGPLPAAVGCACLFSLC